MANLIDTVIIFRILRKLTTPWEKTNAFKTGLIDKNGKILVKKKDRTPEQNKAFTLLDRMVFNLKRLLAKVPGGKTQLGSYVAALALIKEYVEQEANKETADVLVEKLQDHKFIPELKYDISTLEGFMDAWEDSMEEGMTSGASFGGSLSGAGTNQQVNQTGMAGVDPVLNKRRRKLENIINSKL